MCSPLLLGMWSYFYFLIFSKYFILFFKTIISDLAYQTKFPFPSLLLLPYLPCPTPIPTCSSEYIRLPMGSQHSLWLYFCYCFFSFIVFIVVYIFLCSLPIFPSTLSHVPYSPNLFRGSCLFLFPI